MRNMDTSQDPEVLTVMQAIREEVARIARRRMAARRQYGKAAKKDQREQRNAPRLES